MESNLHNENRVLSQDERLAEILGHLNDELLQNPLLSDDEVLTRYPDHAERLRGFLPMMRSIAALPKTEAILADSPRLALPDHESHILGDFRILHELGRGGMGTVYEAEQITLGRRVAIKILPFVPLAHEKALQRFRNEVRAAAALEHPHIVSVYSVGEERGIHYYSMQLIRGQTLAALIQQLKADRKSVTSSVVEVKKRYWNVFTVPRQYTRAFAPQDDKEASSDAAPALPPSTHPDEQAHLSTVVDPRHSTQHYRLAAQLGIEAAEALQHAHEQGVLHRDIKPGNLMLDTDGKLYVTDFGLARIEADAGLTMTGDVLGTLRYMSPEQALAKRVVIDHRADIYSLGATLYELLTLSPLFKGHDRQELLRKIALEEPLLLSKLNSKIPVDLETIVLKTIAKEPTDRYATAQAMAKDLRRFIDGKPVEARRINASQRLWRWSNRNPIVALLSTSVAALATLVAIAISIGYARTNTALTQISQQRDKAQVARRDAQQERQEAQQQRDKALQNLYVAEMRMAQKDWDDGQVARLQQTLLSYLPATGELDQRGWEWYFHLSRSISNAKILHGHDHGVIGSLVWNSDGAALATAQSHEHHRSKDETILWDLETVEAAETLPIRGIKGGLFAWNQGQQQLAYLSDDSGKVMVVQHGEARVTIKSETELSSVAWSPKEKQLASNGPNQTVIIWDSKTGKVVSKLIGHDTQVRELAWSPDGRLLAATGYEPGTITIWNVETGALTSTLKSEQFNWCLAWSPDSRRLAVGTMAGYILVWDVTSSERILSMNEQGEVKTIAWSPDGSQIAAGLSNGAITLRETQSGRMLRQFRQSEAITILAFSPDGEQLGTGNYSGVVHIWSATQDQGIRDIADDAITPAGGIAFSPDDLSLAYWTADQIINISDMETGQVVHRVPGPAGDTLDPAWSPNGMHLACGGMDGSIVIYDLETEEVRSWQHEGAKAPVSSDPNRGVAIAWHPDGRQLASVSDKESTVRIWDALTGKQLHSYESTHGTRPDASVVSSVSWSPDGERLATGGSKDGGGKIIEIRDRVGWRLLHSIDAQAASCKYPTWSDDGRYLAAGGRGLIIISDTYTGRPIQKILGHSAYVSLAGWSKNGQRLATYSKDGARLWNPLTGQELFSIPEAKSMAWSHDRKRIASIENGMVRIYDALIGYELATDPSFMKQKAMRLVEVAKDLATKGSYAQAAQNLNKALSFAATDGNIQSYVAWHMLTMPDENFRDIDTAASAALQGTVLAPKTAWNWMVLGIAQFRIDKWEEARTSLEKLFELDPDSEHPRTSCFLAMACWQLGEKEKARQHYDDAVGWIEAGQIDDETTLSFRNEAAELMGINSSVLDMK